MRLMMFFLMIFTAFVGFDHASILTRSNTSSEFLIIIPREEVEQFLLRQLPTIYNNLDIDQPLISNPKTTDPSKFITKRAIEHNGHSYISALALSNMAIQAMDRIVGETGLLVRQGFIRSGNNQPDGKANLFLVKRFQSFQVIYRLFRRSMEIAVVSPFQMALKRKIAPPLFVIVKFLLRDQGVKIFTRWLQRKVLEEKKQERHSWGGLFHRLHLILEYSCCYYSMDPKLQPKYAEMKLTIS